MKLVLLLFSFYTLGNWGRELLKWYKSTERRFQSRQSGPRALDHVGVPQSPWAQKSVKTLCQYLMCMLCYLTCMLSFPEGYRKDGLCLARSCSKMLATWCCENSSIRFCLQSDWNPRVAVSAYFPPALWSTRFLLTWDDSDGKIPLSHFFPEPYKPLLLRRTSETFGHFVHSSLHPFQ